MPSAERVNEVIRLFLPLVLGIFFCVWGLFRENYALVTLGVGALGIPGLSTAISLARPLSPAIRPPDPGGPDAPVNPYPPAPETGLGTDGPDPAR